MESIFKVGDTVKIRKDLNDKMYFNRLNVNPIMVNKKGKEFKIEQIFYDDYFCFNIYKLNEKGTKWNWCEEMFEGYEEEY